MAKPKSPAGASSSKPHRGGRPGGDYRPKLTASIWDEVREKWEAGASANSLIKGYGIPISTFYRRAKKESWHPHCPDGSPGRTNAMPNSLIESELVPFREILDTKPASDVLALLPPPDSTPEAARLAESARRALRTLDTILTRVRDSLGSPQLRDEGVALKDRTKALLDLCTILEKVQKVERTALGAETDRAGPAGTLVIVVPQKLSEEEWGRQAMQVRPGTSGA